MTFSHGITPSVCTITIPAGQGGTPAEHGTLSFTFGGTTISFPDAKLVETSIEVNDQGQLQHLVIHDRRWKWAWGAVSGFYNQRLAEGTINVDREIDPQKLASLCLDEMGETGYDVSQMPYQAVRPEVNWDYDVPAQCLANLADFLSCRIVLGIDNRVRVVPNGQGADLPGGHFLEDAVVFDPPEKPHTIEFIGGPNRYQGDFDLEPVGRDLDRSIKPIEKLSYKPSCGWEREAFPDFTNVEKEHGLAAMQWARRTVWRWYRFKPPITVPGYGGVADSFQIVPIEAEQVQTWKDPGIPGAGAGDVEKRLDLGMMGDYIPNADNVQAQVFGERRTFQMNYKNTGKDDLYMGAFTIERDLAIVMFHDHICKREDGLRKPAKIYLRTAVSVRHPATRAWVRYWKERVLGGVKTPSRILRHDEVVLSHIGGPINFAECERDADHYLDAAEAEYQQRNPQTRTYNGLLPINLDGAIQQVQWHVGPPYAYTKASRNNEFSRIVPGYAQRRKDEKTQKRWLDEIDAWQKWMRGAKQNRNPFEPMR